MSASMWNWVETTRIAMRIHDSLMLTATLSAVHVIGMTLLAGSVLVSNLRAIGAIFRDRPVIDVTGATRAGILVGLGISVVTGTLLFLPRATAAANNGVFRVKMLVLLAAIAFHFVMYRPLGINPGVKAGTLRMAGTLSLALWFGVVAAGAAFILLE